METMHIRDCQACESALCDYLDGTLTPEVRAELEAHLAGCPACMAYTADIREAMGLLRESESLEAPPILVNKILFQIPAKATGFRARLDRLFAPVMQPRIVMGAMMTVLSLAMMTRCAGVPARSLTTSDLDPVKIWGSFDNRVHRTWERTVKAYESMRLVYEVRSRVTEWRQQQEDQEAAAADQALKTKQLSGKETGSAPSASGQGKQGGTGK